MRRSIVWFKTDLRLFDNETLIHAIQHSDQIIPVFCLDDLFFEKTKFGFRKTGNFRAQFILESLADLDANLRSLGSGLIVVRGDTAEALYQIVKQYNVKMIYAKKEVTFEEKMTEERVEKQIWKLSCSLETFSTSTLYHALDLPFSIRDIPDVFTAFRKRIEQESEIRPVFEKPVSISSPAIPPLTLPTLEDLGLEIPTADSRCAIGFKGGETDGQKRLQHYFYETRSIATYKETRNGMIGDNYSTKFSPWLALGCLSPREIYYELKRYEHIFTANQSTYWLQFELLWRDYFRFQMKKHRNRFFQQNGIKENVSATGTHDPEVLQVWINGTTGDEFINANMTELRLTGFMSNRGRQNVASYLTYNLKQDWRFGAAYFEQQLIDYDPSSNWGNWAYVAGVGNDPRGSRIFNSEKQANDYDFDNTYRSLWLGQS